MTLKKIVIGTLIAISALILYVVIMFIAAFGGFNFLLNVPEPEIKYGEFPCALTYEVDGEIKTIEDIIVCEFDGFKVVGEAGKYRKWKISTSKNTSIQGDGEEDTLLITLLDLSKENKYDEFGHKILELYFYGGNGHHYMSDFLGDHNRDEQDFDYVSYRYETAEGSIGHSSISADEAYEKYKIRLISWKASSPIKNEFK